MKKEEGAKIEEGLKVEEVKKGEPQKEATQPTVIKEIHHHHHYKRGFSVFRLALGLFVILIGLSFLASSFGWSWSIGFDAWKLWPVFVILIGLSMVSRGSAVSSIMGAVVAVAVVAFVALGVFGMGSHQTSVSQGTNPIIAGAVAADVHIATGASSLTVKGTSDTTFFNRVESNSADLVVDSHLVGTTQDVTYSLNQRNWEWFSFKNLLEVHVPDTLPTNLTIDGGAMTSNIDLTDVKASRVAIHTGASHLDLVFGDTVESSVATIDAGASSIHVTLPKAVGVHLTLDTGATSKTLTDFNQTGDKQYTSTNYDTAAHKIDCTIKAGASSITVDWR